ncbi:hypothetical protein [Oecophyllibacter saccharovorans]|uniref:hypothetical protein n=1 Tax=Oecophyllibacter saccharovorans TaxID=2558360 RepID=UPI00116A693A|nr:hypothetical protein [Oecophyllibacter saccharovorans]TPW34887.1 hypothetical protein E3203_05075 [Oecophyllibacter saccharovorans]
MQRKSDSPISLILLRASPHQGVELRPCSGRGPLDRLEAGPEQDVRGFALIRSVEKSESGSGFGKMVRVRRAFRANQAAESPFGSFQVGNGGLLKGSEKPDSFCESPEKTEKNRKIAFQVNFFWPGLRKMR